MLNTRPGESRRPDALVVVDLDPASAGYGTVIGRTDVPHIGDELHHLGWNACSSALCPWAAHPHVERRYLLVPGVRSSRIHVLDVKDERHQPRLVKTIDAAQIARDSGYSRPHTVHCGPDGIYVSALGAPDGGGPGGIFVLDHDDFDVKGRWEDDRGPQELAYDFWWHLGSGRVVTSEWGTPDMVEAGVDVDLLLGGGYGRALHLWDMKRRRHIQSVDLGAREQIVLKLCPAHDPSRNYGYAGVGLSMEDLSGSVWLWFLRDDGTMGVEKVIRIPARPAEADRLPEILKPLGSVPPIITDVTLSVDDRTLFVSCWGTGELHRFDVSDPRSPRPTGAVRIGGIVERAPHPSSGPLNGGPQMVELSRDGRRVYVTNSLFASWDRQFYPDNIDGWMVKLDNDPAGGLAFDPGFFVEFRGERPHQVRLEGGDASSDSYGFPS